MLTREQLSKEQWAVVRNTPHLVMLAVSSIGGSVLDEMLERKAGLQGIAEAMHSTNPLLRQLAEGAEIMQAQKEVRAWYYTLDDASRSSARLQVQALESMRRALSALAAHGLREDLLLYRDFIVATASRVARAAREGDVLGFGGELISAGERQFIGQLENIALGSSG